MIKVRAFLECLIKTSEKASEISRIIRLEYLNGHDGEVSNSIATEEKMGQRRVDGDTDAKTLADVLCQSVIDSELRAKFPGLKKICGEENGNFQSCANTDNLHVKIGDSVEENSSMLAKALPNKPELVATLSALIHSTVELPVHISEEISAVEGAEVDLSDISVWIDPIDATTEYVKARQLVFEDGIVYQGLSCCTVLIGAYNSINGQPIAGVVSRPFADRVPETADSTGWKSEIYWGYVSPCNSLSVFSPNCACHGHTEPPHTGLKIATSAGERMPFVVNNPQYDIISPKGAGNKIMTVVTGLTNLYVITVESNLVFRWDMCAGHALLKAHGGGILSYKNTRDALLSFEGKIENFPFSDYAIDYSGNDEPLVDGIVAYKDLKHLLRFFSDLLEHLAESH